MIFGFDIDGVLCNSAPMTLDRVCDNTGQEYRYQDFTKYGAGEEIWPEMKTAYWEATYELYGEMWGFPPCQDGAMAFHTVQLAGYPIHILTARQRLYAGYTAWWLRDRGFSDVGFHPQADKVKLSKELGITHFIEDKPETAVMLARAGVEVGMPIRPWTRALAQGKGGLIEPRLMVQEPNAWVLKHIRIDMKKRGA
jgi:hypothetical protein